ncbi:MAG: L-carnitine dehydrogenase [Alphaproteobacteria bacterium]|nr:MAG: L-carnitine dehydrogenase [Alphaproteobacteria bacterium]
MTIKRAAVIGGGVIGAGWVARLIENGIDVAVFDPAPDAGQKLQAVLDNAERAYGRLLPKRLAKGKVARAASVGRAVTGTEWIVEAVPERLDLKRQVYAEVEAAADPAAIIASSTSGILPSELQANLAHPGRLIVGHPFNPVYLLPLVEIVAGRQTSPATVEAAGAFYASIGMKPLVVRKEIDAFIADRLLEAVWRESLWLVKDGICTTEELDDAIRYGFGLRWAQMGLFETYRIAGGEAGMRHFLAQFGPCLTWPWTKLTDVPEFNDELVDLIAGQSDAQSGHLSIRELERIRDDNLIAIMDALSRANDGLGWGAGAVLADYRRRLARHAAQADG